MFGAKYSGAPFIKFLSWFAREQIHDSLDRSSLGVSFFVDTFFTCLFSSTCKCVNVNKPSCMLHVCTLEC